MLTCFAPQNDGIHRSAIMADNNTRRYLLTRRWGHSQSKALLFVGLNPSTANGERDDPTLRRLMRLAVAWEYGRLLVCNLFSLVSPHPNDLLGQPDLVGPDNDITIHAAVRESLMVLAGWGSWPGSVSRQRWPEVAGRVEHVLKSGLLGNEVYCLGQNADGSPKHPLYLPRGVKPAPYRPYMEVAHA